MTHRLDPQVSALMRSVAAGIILPRYRSLAVADIIEKEPGDLVTIADREAEERLSEGLAAILPEALIVGEEAAAMDAALVNRVGEGLVWIIDPIDGTGNFAAGNPPFAVMVALVADGETEAGWILDPLTGRMCHAARGRGAFVDGEQVHTRPTGAPLPVVSISTRFVPPGMAAEIEARIPGRITPAAPPLCAGEQYPRLVLGENDAALYWRSLPWDHAPGALFLTEAGGRIARADGSPYRPADRRTGLLGAASPALWDRVAGLLWG